MSGASEAVDALQTAGREVYRLTFEAGNHFARRHSDLQATSDLVDTMARTIDLITAIEALHDATDAGVRSLRAVLSATMSETGAASIHGTHHTAYLSKRPAFVSIDDEQAIPPEFIIQTPSIDKRALKAAMKDGAQIPGASLLTPNEPVLVLRSRKEPS